MTTAKTQQDQPEAVTVDTVERLKRDFEKRKAADRPMSHSLAVAYQKVIAQCAQAEQPKPPQSHS